MIVDDIAKTCGISLPDTFLAEAEELAKQKLVDYGCDENPEAVRALAYLILLNDRDVVYPCVRKITEYLLFICPGYFEDMVF